MKVQRERDNYNSTHSKPSHEMEVSGQIHAPALYTREKTDVSIEYMAR
jgi:hypothetical protein